MHLDDAFAAAVQEAKNLREQGAHLAILVAHMPANLAKTKYMRSKHFDVILGADDHNLDVLHTIGGPLYVQSEQDARYVSIVDSGFLQVSGMQVTYDLRKPQGSRVVSIRINGKPINPNTTYTLATNDFIANGGDGYSMFKQGRHLIDAKERQKAADVIAALLASAQHQKISHGTDNRIVIMR